jgi:hypothetical protein
METRQITQVKIWKLILNPMTSNTENGSLVASSDNRENLLNWYKNEFADEPYYSIGEHYFPAKGLSPENFIGEYKYYKVFKQGSVLEWMNPMLDETQLDDYGHGISWQWVDEEIWNTTSIFKVF